MVILPGWNAACESHPEYVEADLKARPGFDDTSSPIWFVAAPGAVGKSTLAREICAQTNAVYLNLADAETVAGNYLTGGLVKNHLYDAWREGRTAILIDALDEARLRVTQRSFEDFLYDVLSSSIERPFPTVLFGRVSIIEEAWLILSERKAHCP